MPPALIVVGAVVAGAIVATVAMRARVKTPSVSGMNRGVELARKLEADRPREVAVGLASGGGSGIYETISGTSNNLLYRVTALSDYEITGFRELWLDGARMTLSGNPMTGWVNVTGRYIKGDEGVTPGPAIRLRVMSGTEDQALDSVLSAAAGDELTTNDRFAGMAVAILELTYDQEAFKGGEPEAFYVFDGAPVHDPDHEGSDPDDPSTWPRDTDARYNAALVTAQALRGWKRGGEIIVGGYIANEDVPDDRLSEAAAICAEPMDTDDGTEPRYRVGGFVRIDPQSGIRPSLEHLLAAMDGDLAENGGVFTILPGAERVPSAYYDMRAIGGRTTHFDPYGGATQRKNHAECTFIDPNAAWQAQPLEVYAPPAYLAADNGRYNAMSIGLEMVPFRYQAGRVQKAKLDRSRLFARAVFDLPLIAMQTEPGDWFTVTDRLAGLSESVWEASKVTRVNTPRGARVIIEADGISIVPWAWGGSDIERTEPSYTAPDYPPRVYTDADTPVVSLEPVYIEGGGAKEPAIRATASFNDSPYFERIDWQWRNVADDERVYSRTSPAAERAFNIREGIVPSGEFQVRARLTGSGPRQGQWSSWVSETAPAEYVVPDASIPSERMEVARNAINAALGTAAATFEEALEIMAEFAGLSGDSFSPLSLLNWLDDPLFELGVDAWTATKGSTFKALGEYPGVKTVWDFDIAEENGQTLHWPARRTVRNNNWVQASADVEVAGVVNAVQLWAVFEDEAGEEIAALALGEPKATGRTGGTAEVPDDAKTVYIMATPIVSEAGQGTATFRRPIAAYALPGQSQTNEWSNPNNEIVSQVAQLMRTVGREAQSWRLLQSETRSNREGLRQTFAAVQENALAITNEAEARAQLGTALTTQFNTALNDSAAGLQAQINTRATVTQLNTAISNEAAARASMGSALETQFNTALNDSAAGLQAQINTRATVTQLNTAISNEAAARAAALTALESNFASTYLTQANAASTYVTQADVNNTIASYNLTLNASFQSLNNQINQGNSSLSSLVSILAGAIIDSGVSPPRAKAILELITQASGSNPAILRLMASNGTSDAVLAANTLYFANMAANGDPEVAMLVVNRIIRVVKELRLEDQAVLTQYIGSALGLAIGLDPITGKRGIFLRNSAGQPLMIANLTDQVFQLYPDMAIEGFAAHKTRDFVAFHQLTTGSGSPRLPGHFVALSRTSSPIPYSQGVEGEITLAYTIRALRNSFEWFGYRDRLILQGRTGSGSWTTLQDYGWEERYFSTTSNTGAAPGGYPMGKVIRAREWRVAQIAQNYTVDEVRVLLDIEADDVQQSTGNAVDGSINDSYINSTLALDNVTTNLRQETAGPTQQV